MTFPFPRKHIRIIAATCLTLLSFQDFAQNATISGVVTGMNADDVPVATLLLAKDSSIAKSGFCNAEGHYEFDLIRPNQYLVQITNMGYSDVFSNTFTISDSAQSIQLDTLILKAASNELSEVQIVHKKAFVERKIDRVVVNPEALISNSGTTALDVLAKSPGIIIDGNDNISLKGKQGVVVFIDDKPTYMAAAELPNYLRSLSSSLIASIEIMSNPPAQYDAAGNAGIVNIKLKHDKQRGLNMGLNLSYGQGKYLRTNNSFNINYRIDKFNFFGSIGISQNNSYQNLTINRYYYTNDGSYNSAFNQNSYIKQKRGGKNARVGFDYYMSAKSTFGMVLSGFVNPSTPTNNNNATISDKNDAVTSYVKSYTTSDERWKNGSINLNYAYKFDEKGRMLTVNGDYITYNSRQSQSLENNVYTPDFQLTDNSLLTSTLPADIVIKTIKLDYAHPLNDGSKFDIGYKSSFVNTDNTASFFDVVDGVSTPNYVFSNRFKYKENINAAYLNYSKTFSKFALQLGLRLENTNLDGNQLGNAVIPDSSFSRHYTNLFPTLFLSYTADSLQKNQFGLSMGRRIDRPDYHDLNPFTYPIDRYTYYGGNPFLQPTYSYNFELSHTYKNAVTTTFEYSIADNLIQETNEQRGTIYYSRPGNFGRQTVFGFSLNATLPVTKWWTLLLYSECKNIAVKSQIYTETIDENKWYVYVGPTCQFTVTKSLSAELAGSYQSRILSGQFLTIPVWQMRAGLSQKILKDQGSIRLNLSDMFYTNQPGGDIRNIANSKADWLSYLDTRVLTVSFSYRFNKGKTLKARDSGGSDMEKGRVKAG